MTFGWSRGQPPNSRTVLGSRSLLVQARTQRKHRASPLVALILQHVKSEQRRRRRSATTGEGAELGTSHGKPHTNVWARSCPFPGPAPPFTLSLPAAPGLGLWRVAGSTGFRLICRPALLRAIADSPAAGSPFQLLFKLLERCRHPVADGFAHARDRQTMKRLLDGPPISFSHEHRVAAGTGDLYRFVRLGHLLSQDLVLF